MPETECPPGIQGVICNFVKNISSWEEREALKDWLHASDAPDQTKAILDLHTRHGHTFVAILNQAEKIKEQLGLDHQTFKDRMLSELT